MRVVSLERPLKGHQPPYVFKLVFDLEYLISYIALQEPGPKHMFLNFFLHLDKMSILYLIYLTSMYYKNPILNLLFCLCSDRMNHN